MFRKKVIPFEVFSFSRFDRNSRKFLYHLSCLVPGRRYYASVIRFGSRGPGRSAEIRHLNQLTAITKQPFVHTYKCQASYGNTSEKERMLKIWKMAADFQNVYRYNASLCSSVVLAEVLEHYCKPVGENELSFVVVTCVFLLLVWFELPACLSLSYIWGRRCGCWLLVSLTKCGCCSSQII